MTKHLYHSKRVMQPQEGSLDMLQQNRCWFQKTYTTAKVDGKRQITDTNSNGQNISQTMWDNDRYQINGNDSSATMWDNAWYQIGDDCWIFQLTIRTGSNLNSRRQCTKAYRQVYMEIGNKCSASKDPAEICKIYQFTNKLKYLLLQSKQNGGGLLWFSQNFPGQHTRQHE